MYSTSKTKTDQPVSLDPAVPQCSLEQTEELTKEPIHIIKLAPKTEIIEILGARLVTNELLDNGLNEHSQEIPHDATKGETPRKQAISHVQQSTPRPFEEPESD